MTLRKDSHCYEALNPVHGPVVGFQSCKFVSFDK